MSLRLFARLLHTSRPVANRAPRFIYPGTAKPAISVPAIPNIKTSSVIDHPNSIAPSIPELERTRVVPTLETFYSSNPIHEKNMRDLNDLLNRYASTPYTINSEESAKHNKTYRWLNINEYRLIAAGTRLKTIQYSKLVELLQRLDAIDKQLVDKQFMATLDRFKKSVSDSSAGASVKQLDEFGRAIAVGGRKSSRAKVYLVRGDGKIIVNGESLSKMFPRLTDRNKILYPLKVVDGEGSYNVFVKCSGGGVSGKVGAIAHGIARALLIFNPLLKPRLKRAGATTRDARRVERKKPGKVKSRKSPTWVKR
ncbi:mitochondrial 37S ribosomal protein [Saccharomycopsis crataegensis]|uniref:Small ribosomal subunit protein uS9m n=1 Tax=Saccharomycopsis crataegensis TaxID=43959 RepID=A0AAV5QJV5_9ASCO|nr:mitochondrial 37S ribosomal protein [Saccharomycopsis crataegensis]